MTPGCPTPEILKAMLWEEPNLQDEPGVARHVEKCAQCQELLEALTGTTASEPAAGSESTSADSANPVPESRTVELFVQRLQTEGQTFRSLWHALSFLPNQSDDKWTDGARPLPIIPDFEILGELGSGGMGIVYRARQLGLNRLVALKMLRVDQDSSSLARFRGEAEAVARLQHPHIVQIHEIGTVEGRPYLCLEYVGGGTLAERVARGPFVPRDAAALIATLARGIHHAHMQGILHRDLKPSNILFTVDGMPKVADFGLAKHLGPASADGTAPEPQTRTGDIMGTPAYMAPEQASGRTRRLGPSVDIHALGTILYELLTGRVPFQGETPLDTLLQVIHEEPVPPHRLQPRVPPDLETITLKCLEKEPSRRYLTAQELADDLDRFLAGEPVAARPPSVFYHWRKFARRNKGLVSGLVATLLALAAGLIVTLLFAASESRLRQEADSNAQAADQARQVSLREAYQARLSAALGLLQAQRVGEAARQLDAAPSSLRGWEWWHLHARLDDSLYTLPLPPLHDRVVLMPTDGDWRLLTYETGHAIQIWEVARQKRLPDAEASNVLHCWRLSSRAGLSYLVEQLPIPGPLVLLDAHGKARFRFNIPRSTYFNMAAISPDGLLIALAVNNEGRCIICDAVKGTVRQELTASDLRHTVSLAFSPDGKWLATGDANGTISLWDAATWKRKEVLRRHRGIVRTLAFSPDSQRLASGADDRLLCQWDLPSGRLASVLTGHDGSVNIAAYSPNGEWLASGGGEGAVRIWSVRADELAVLLTGHRSLVVQMHWNAHSTELATATYDEARIWGVLPGGGHGVLRDHRSSVYAAAYSPCGRWFASGGWDGRVRVWDAASGSVRAVFAAPPWVASLAFSPDGNTLVARVFNSELYVWNVPQRRLLAKLSHPAPMYQSWMHTVAISRDGKLLAAAVHDQLRFWDLATLHEKPALRLPAKGVRLAIFSPDSQRVAVVGDDHTVYLLSVATGQVLQTLGHGGLVQVIAFHPDGRRLVSAGADLKVRLWDTATGQLLDTLVGHTGEIFAAAFHPDGTRLVTGGRDRVLRVWDVTTGDAILWLEGHRGMVFSLAFSPDGSTLLSAGGDQTVRLWDTFPAARRFQARMLTDKP